MFEDEARRLTKAQTRKPAVDRMLAGREQDIETMVKLITGNTCQRTLRQHIDGLNKRS